MELRIASDTLLGHAQPFTDFHNGDTMPRANAAAIRVSCSELPDSTNPFQRARLARLHSLVAAKPGDVEDAHRALQQATESLLLTLDSFSKPYANTQFATLHAMIARYRHDTGHLPPTLRALAPYATVPPPDERWMRDRWGKPIDYVRTGSSYELRIVGEPISQNDTGTVVSAGPKT